MIKTISSVLFVFLFTNLSIAQQDFTLSDAVIGGYTKFRPETKSQLSWVPNKTTISWVVNDSTGSKLVQQNVGDAETAELFNLTDLQKNEALKELKALPRMKWLSSTLLRFKSKNTTFTYDYSSKELSTLFQFPEGSGNEDYSPNKKDVAYTTESGLWVNNSLISKDSNNILSGQAVHRFEFGISKGTFWSTKGESLAFYQKDESMVTDYPLANYNTTPAIPNIIKYPMAGMPSHHVKIGIWNSKTQKTIWLKTGEPKEQYLTNVAWSPDDKSIYVAILNRDQNEVNLNEYDPVTGELVKTLFTEKHEKYVQPLHPMEFTDKNGEQFIWQSERDGFNNLYLYNTKGKLIKQLTKHEAPITDVVAIEKENYVTYMVADNNGLDRIAYRLNLETEKSEKITQESGVHSIKLSSDGNHYVDYFTSLSTRLNVTLNSISGKSLLTLNENPNPYEAYNVRLPELGTITTKEGVTLNTRMFKPFDFDPSKKYKALLYVYNGPGVQLITNRWMAGGSPWMAHQANKGYIVYTVDGRGSENRGRDFEQAIFRQLGELEVVDQLSAAEYLYNLDFVDRKKMAVHGWSYGGFMTTSIMLKAPGIFQVGVAGGPVIDWKYYEIMYTERYMDTPEQNPTGYAKASLLDKVGNLKGSLMLIHGADDDVVVPQHSIDLLKHSVDAGVQIHFFLYPGHKHNVRGKDRVHLMEKVLDYIDEKLD